jgi:hypothetical protein
VPSFSVPDAAEFLEAGTIPVRKRRTLLTRWAGETWRELEEERKQAEERGEHSVFYKAFLRTGCLVTADGSGDDQISIDEMEKAQPGYHSCLACNSESDNENNSDSDSDSERDGESDGESEVQDSEDEDDDEAEGRVPGSFVLEEIREEKKQQLRDWTFAKRVQRQIGMDLGVASSSSSSLARAAERAAYLEAFGRREAAWRTEQRRPTGNLPAKVSDRIDRQARAEVDSSNSARVGPGRRTRGRRTDPGHATS